MRDSLETERLMNTKHATPPPPRHRSRSYLPILACLIGLFAVTSCTDPGPGDPATPPPDDPSSSEIPVIEAPGEPLTDPTDSPAPSDPGDTETPRSDPAETEASGDETSESGSSDPVVVVEPPKPKDTPEPAPTVVVTDPEKSDDTPEPDKPESTTRGSGGSSTITTRGGIRDLGSGGSGAPDSPEPADQESSKEYHTVDVYYGTNRKPTPHDDSANEQYGGGRNREGPMEYGRTTVSIPLHHRIGLVERPKWYRLEFSETPKKHVVILELEKMESDPFFSEVDDAAAGKVRNEALLFIHGFNVPFDDAIRRTAQIAFDLDFAGVPLVYSWPSQGSLKAYTIDEANAEWSIPHLSRFLLDLQESTEIEKIHVIAHSMGTRVLSYALANATDEGFDLDLHNVILAAPDIDVDVFKEQILPKITDSADKMTMYASSDDTALKVSQGIHGSARLGLSGDSISVLDGMDTVNASGIDTSMIGHGYYGSQKVVVKDIFNLIIHGLEPIKRKLIPGPLGEWDFAEIGR